jgi:hypothetical protein
MKISLRFRYLRDSMTDCRPAGLRGEAICQNTSHNSEKRLGPGASAKTTSQEGTTHKPEQKVDSKQSDSQESQPKIMEEEDTPQTLQNTSKHFQHEAQHPMSTTKDPYDRR